LARVMATPYSIGGPAKGHKGRHSWLLCVYVSVGVVSVVVVVVVTVSVDDGAADSTRARRSLRALFH
jgi:hypothetical protein